MQIDKDYLKSLKPCEGSYKNYLINYKDWIGTLTQFLDLPEVSHKDKLWVYFRSVKRNVIGLIAADLAESVLHLYESKYPEDNSPRKAIEAARNTTMSKENKYAAAYDASAAASSAVLTVAAYYAAYAASQAAYAAYHAASTEDAYASAIYATHAADDADDADARKKEQEKQIQILKNWCIGE